VILDVNGEATIYWRGTYKVNLTTSADAQVPGWPEDDVTDISTDIASTAPGKGAALVGVEDVGEYWSGENQEAVNQEIGAYIHVRREKFNVMGAVPLAERAAITAGASSYDTLPHFMEALDYFGAASSAARGLIEVPRGLFKISGKIPLRYEVSLRGLAGRASRIQSTGDFPVIGWDASVPSFSRQVAISDLAILGAGAGTGFANSVGIDLDHVYGLDNLELKRLYITDCGAWGIRTNQPGGTSVNCSQFATWDNINIGTSANGIKLGFGFTGESVFDNITVVGVTGKCVEFVTNSVPVGAQGLNFNGLFLGQSAQGIVFNGGTAGILVFNGLHVENMSTNCVEFNSSATAQVIFNNPWLVRAPALIKGNAGSIVDIVSGTWEVNNVAHKYIELSAASNFLIKLSGNHRRITSGTGVSPTDDITATDISSIYGSVLRKSATTGTIAPRREAGLTWQGRGIMSETATVTPNNLTGATAIGNGSSSVAIVFARAEPDTSYRIAASVDWGASVPPAWNHNLQVGSKTTAGFTVSFGAAAPAGGAVLNWVLTR